MNIVVAFLVFGLLVLVHELGHFLAARKNGILVEEFAIGMGPKLVGFQRGDTLYTIRILPFGGFCKMLGEDEVVDDDERAFSRKSVGARIVVVIAGAAFNIILALIFACIVVGMSGSLTTTIQQTTPGTPAYDAGLREGDKIKKVDNHNILASSEVSLYINLKKGEPVDIEFVRDGETHLIHVTPIVDGERFIINASFKPINRGNIFEVIKYGFIEVAFWIKTVFLSLGMIFQGKVSREDIGGPVRIISEISKGYTESVKYGVRSMFLTISNYIVLLSANLGIMNLLPIPALDGGRLIFLLIEAIRKKPISREKEGYVHFVGFVLLMILMVFMVFNDAINIW